MNWVTKLFGCGANHDGGDDTEEGLRQEYGEEGVEGAEDSEDGGYFHEDDEGEGEGDADGEVNSDAAACFAAGDTEADEGHDNDGEGVEEALVEFNLGGGDGGGAAHLFVHDVAVELG